jgi:hypothetical protein
MPQMFPTILRPASFTSNQELSLSVGPTSTIVFMTSNANRTFFGLAAVGGNQDGMVVCFVNVSNTANWQHIFAHDSSSASNVINRFLMPGQGNLNTGTGIGSCTVVYNGTMQRWLCISDTV